MKLPALAMYGAFALIALGVRSVIQASRTGRSPIPVPSTSIAWLGQGLLTAGLFASPAGVAFGREGPLSAAGVGLLGLGVVGTVVAQAQMGASWRAGLNPSERTELVTHGLFSVVRNPIYACMVLAGAGMALVVSNVVTISSAVAILAGAEIVVRGVEEPYLRSTHGARFEAYAAATPRFIGVRRARR